MYLTLASKARLVVQAMEDVTFIFSYNSLLVLKDFLYVPEIMKNLISISNICKLNYSFFFLLNRFVLDWMIHLYAQDDW